MTVAELIAVLHTMPADAEVFHLWDGEPRTGINVVYLARNGCVITADYDEVCYSTFNRPHGSPTSNEDWDWHTPQDPELTD